MLYEKDIERAKGPSAVLGSLAGKCMIRMLMLQVLHSEAYLASAWLGRLLGKCLLGSLFGKDMIGMHVSHIFSRKIRNISKLYAKTTVLGAQTVQICILEFHFLTTPLLEPN